MHRIFDPKYYKDHDPPLSALNEYFEHHGFRAMIRPDEGQSDLGDSGDAEEQHRWIDGIAAGSKEGIGGKRAWAERIELVEAEDEALGISSTAVRRAAKSRDWEAVGRLCSEGVARWMQEFGLYQDEEQVRGV